MSRFRSLFAPLPLLQRNEERWFWLFIAPFLAGFVLFALLPLIASLALSFMDWNLRGTPKLVGLENYADLVNLEGKGKLVLKAFSNTAMITIIAVPLQLAVGMSFAVLLNQKVRGMPIYRMAFYLPTVVSGVATAALWTWILGSEGLLNKALDLIGVSGPAWFNEPESVRWGIIFMLVWAGTGGMTLIFLAGLQQISKELLEAAECDGAGRIRRFFSVTLPLLSPTLFFNLVIGLIGGLSLFTEPFVISGGAGGPANESMSVALLIYRLLIRNLDFGFGSAVAWLLTLVVMLLTVINFRLSKRWVFYDN
ncbi:MAG: sugar ABC transporter permease [Chloroflexi bacterium]|nr:sugar ABC transporter permease [Chloroflexota bacterium]